MDWLSLFILSFSAGTAVYPLIMAKRSLVSESFPRVPFYTGFFLGVVYLMLSQREPYDLAFVSGLAALCVLWRSRPASSAMCVFITAIFGFILAAKVGAAPPIGRAALAAVVTGYSLGTMLLGHSYLSNKLMSFDVLIHNARVLFILLLLNAAAAATPLVISLDELEAMYVHGNFNFVVILLRIISGVFAAPALAFMALRCARICSNQSATGILYSLCVFVIISEMASMYCALGSGAGA